MLISGKWSSQAIELWFRKPLAWMCHYFSTLTQAVIRWAVRGTVRVLKRMCIMGAAAMEPQLHPGWGRASQRYHKQAPDTEWSKSQGPVQGCTIGCMEGPWQSEGSRNADGPFLCSCLCVCKRSFTEQSTGGTGHPALHMNWLCECQECPFVLE